MGRSVTGAPLRPGSNHVGRLWSSSVRDLIQNRFTSTKSFLNTAPELHESLRSKLNIPQFFFDRMYLQSNGFSGYDIWLDQNEEVESYTYWSRFTVKQTYDKLKPKRTFTPHVSNHNSSPDNWHADIAIHGPQSTRHGWEWYEMGFFTYWNQSGLTTLLCFDLPARSQSDIQSMFGSQSIDRSCPYAMFSLISDALLRLYDDSVWSIRNHISQWEARRSQEIDYFLLHEIARHAVHVSETLNVTIQSLDAIRQHHERFRTNTDLALSNNGRRRWDKVGSRFEFQLRFLQGLLQRSEANNARIQNEITLAFNAAAQRDSKIQVRIGEEAKREASAMKGIAMVTMTFLPATFASTLFGMNFFSFGPSEGIERSSFIVSRHFWIYWAFTVPMTFVTFAMWFGWNYGAKRLRLSSSRSGALRA